MKLSDVARDERGTLYEIPLIIAFLGVALAVGIGERSWWKGPVYAALGLAALLGAVVACVAVLEKLEDVPVLKKIMDWRLWEWAGALFGYAMGAAGGGALAGFVSMFAAPMLSDTPPGQLALMRGMVLAGAACGAAVTWRARRRPRHF